MMKTYFSPLFLFFCLVLLHPVQAQWQQIALPKGLPANNFVHHQGYYFINYRSNIFRSTDGVQWHTVASPDMDIQNFSSLQLFSDGTRLYANLFHFTNDHGLYASEDNGETWTLTNVTLNVPSGKFVATADALYAYTPGFSMASKSVDHGATWQTILSESSAINGLDVHDSTIVVLTALHLVRSSDGGATWTEVSNVIKGTSGGGQFTVWAPVHYAGDGVWFTQNVFARSTDDGLTWEQIPLPAGYVYPTRIAGFQGKIWMTNNQFDTETFVSTDKGLNWIPDLLPGTENQLLGVGDTLFAAGFSGCFYSLDNGENWNTANKGDLTQFDAPTGVQSGRFFTSGNRLFAAGDAGNDIYYTENDGEDWHYVKARNEGRFLVKGDTVLAEPNQLSYDGGLHYSLFPDPMMNEFALADDAIWGLKGDDGVYRSTDGGQNWVKVNFPGTPDFSASIAWAKQGIWVADYSGVHVSFDDGANWQLMEEGLDDLIDPNSPRILGRGEQLFLQTHLQLYYFENGRWNPSGFSDKKFSLSSSGRLEIFENGKAVIFDYFPQTILYLTQDGGKNWAKIQSDFLFADPWVVVATDENMYALAGDTNAPSFLFYFKRNFAQIQLSSISGKIFDDQNANEVYDPGEPPLKNAPLYLVNSRITMRTDSAGVFNLLAETTGGDTLYPALYSQYYFSVPQSHPVSASGGTFDFAVQVNPGVQDINLTATNVNVFRPGFHTNIVLTVDNPGTVAVAPEVHFPLPDSLVFQNALPAPVALVNNEVIWNLPLLEPLAQTDIHLNVYTKQEAPLGIYLTMTAEARPVDSDLTPLDNRSTIRDLIVGSFDPNDKQCNPEFISPDMALAGERVEYTVRFQNTGNYAASFVYVRDTLSANLDASTAEPLSASHPYRFIRHNGNVLEVFFENIQLPDSTSDNEGSHGFIKFAVRTRPGLAIGETVENRAGIYFDFNPPVMTNTVVTTVKTTGLPVEPATPPLSIMPNPAGDVAVVSLETAGAPVTRFLVADIFGRVVQNVPGDNGRGVVDVKNLPAGVYYVSAYSDARVLVTGKLVVQRLK